MSASQPIWPPTDPALRTFTWFAVFVAGFILIHPYAGIVHDNVLYLAQALLRLNPDIYGDDAFFKWGSQDSYTLFSPMYAWLVVHLGVNNATVNNSTTDALPTITFSMLC